MVYAPKLPNTKASALTWTVEQIFRNVLSLINCQTDLGKGSIINVKSTLHDGEIFVRSLKTLVWQSCVIGTRNWTISDSWY